MNWELVISIAALVTGGGCVIWIFQAGSWKGEVSTTLKNMDAKLSDLTDKVNDVDKIKSDINNKNSSNLDSLREEFNAALVRLHQRIDAKEETERTRRSLQQALETKLDVLIAGLQAQRQDWDTLRNDVRSLLRSEATTINEQANFKERLAAFEAKRSADIEKLVRVESDVAHILSTMHKK